MVRLSCPERLLCLLMQVGVSIRMSSFNLTRIVTISPFFSLLNKSSYELEVGEVSSHSSTRWHYVSSAEVTLYQCRAGMAVVPTGTFGASVSWSSELVLSVFQCLPFWPENPSGKLHLRVVGSESTSSHFVFSQQDNGTLLSLDMVRL